MYLVGYKAGMGGVGWETKQPFPKCPYVGSRLTCCFIGAVIGTGVEAASVGRVQIVQSCEGIVQGNDRTA